MDKTAAMELFHASLKNTIEELERVDGQVDETELLRAAQAILQCEGKILVTGVGTSGAAARKVAHSLSCIEFPAGYLHPGDALHGASGTISPGDLLILFSKGGKSEEINKLSEIAGRRGALRLAVTESRDNPLGRSTELTLRIKIQRESDQLGLLATASTLAVVAAFDALCNILMRERGFGEEAFAIIHPGGAVGEKLSDQKRRRDD